MPPHHSSKPAIPTTSSLPSTLLLPSRSSAVFRILSRLSRPDLASLALSWLDPPPAASKACQPCLRDAPVDEEEDRPIVFENTGGFVPAVSVEELREIYRDFEQKKGNKRDVLDRIIECDWNNGLSLYQIADASTRCLLGHPSSQRWSCVKLVHITGTTDDNGNDAASKADGQRVAEDMEKLPQLRESVFLRNIQREIAPLVKAHFYLHRSREMALTLLRIYFTNSPYNSQNALSAPLRARKSIRDMSRTIWIAFPQATPYLYISSTSAEGEASNSMESRNLRSIILDALPRAFSRPGERYELQKTELTAKSLRTLFSARGPGRGNNSGGGWSIFADGTAESTPLEIVDPAHEDSEQDGTTDEAEGGNPGDSVERGKKRKREDNSSDGTASDSAIDKHLRKLAKARFGNSGLEDDGKGIDRLEIQLRDPFMTAGSEAAETRDEGSANVASEPQDQDSHSSHHPPDEAAASEAAADDDSEHVQPEADSGLWIPDVNLKFHGAHIFAGIRRMVENGLVDGRKMPSWMTGEYGVSIGVVRQGRIITKNKGARL